MNETPIEEAADLYEHHSARVIADNFVGSLFNLDLMSHSMSFSDFDRYQKAVHAFYKKWC